MRILFIGGMCRGFRLAERLVERGEDVVGAFVYEEDAHESPKFCDQLVSLLSTRTSYVRKTRRIPPGLRAEIRDELAPDVIFCLGWRTLIPLEVLHCAPHGGVAVHDSLLPRLRGFAPTNWGLILGHDQLGATLFQLTDAMDAGDVYFQDAISPQPRESYESVQSRIADLSVELFVRYLDATRAGTLIARSQNEADATYTCARTPADGEICWQDSSLQIARLVRALGSPAPGAFSYYLGEPLIIDRAWAVENPRHYAGRIPGRMVDRDLAAGTVDVLCGDGVLRIERVRTTTGQDQSAAAVLRSVRESLGLNYSQEIISLRQRLTQLELQLAERPTGPMLRQTG